MRFRTFSIIAGCLCFFAGCSLFEKDPASEKTPAEIQLVTADIDNFWSAYDLAYDTQTTLAERSSIFQTHYLDAGSEGLVAFVDARIKSAAELVGVTDRLRQYYSAVRENTRQVASDDFLSSVRGDMEVLQRLYPEARFVNVFFLIGKMGTGGTVSEKGLLIGTELFSRDADTPITELNAWQQQVTRPLSVLPSIVAHELIHVQQKYLGQTRTVLEQSIMEGSADFIGEIISGGHANDHVHLYGNSREAEVWNAFKADMSTQAIGRWLYNAGQTTGETPADLGYYVGYKICEAFYQRTENKQEAIAAILNITDFDSFLTKSGYAEKFLP